MNTTQAENLRSLIRRIEPLPTPLGMDQFHHPCGTPSCAAGYAKDMRLLSEATTEGYADAFGADSRMIRRLFGEAEFNVWGRNDVTPQEWAVEARKVLAENGYSMDEAKPIPTVRERLDALYVPDASVLNSGAADPFKPGMTYDEFFAEARRLGI